MSQQQYKVLRGARSLILPLVLAGCASVPIEPPAPEPAPAPIEVLPVATAQPEPVPQLIRMTVQRIVMPTGHVPLGEETDVWLIEPRAGWPRCVVANGGVSCGWGTR